MRYPVHMTLLNTRRKLGDRSSVDTSVIELGGVCTLLLLRVEHSNKSKLETNILLFPDIYWTHRSTDRRLCLEIYFIARALINPAKVFLRLDCTSVRTPHQRSLRITLLIIIPKEISQFQNDGRSKALLKRTCLFTWINDKCREIGWRSLLSNGKISFRS